jgi:hypothetical protein
MIEESVPAEKELLVAGDEKQVSEQIVEFGGGSGERLVPRETFLGNRPEVGAVPRGTKNEFPKTGVSAKMGRGGESRHYACNFTGNLKSFPPFCYLDRVENGVSRFAAKPLHSMNLPDFRLFLSWRLSTGWRGSPQSKWLSSGRSPL